MNVRLRSRLSLAIPSAFLVAACTEAPPEPLGREGAELSSVQCGVANQYQSLQLACPAGQTIRGVTFASYGTATGACGSYAVNPSCHAATSESVVRTQCVGKTACTVPANNETFGDPCPGVSGKRLSVQLACDDGATSTGTRVCATAPERNPFALACPAGQVIDTIDFASYGTPNGTCGAFTTSACNAASSLAVLRQQCVGKASCALTADNALFGDPCSGVGKRLYAQATCKGAAPPPPPPPSGPAVCIANVNQGGSGTLACPAGQQITAIDFASYGRPTGSCGSFAVTTSCDARYARESMQNACIGRNACTFTANNETFGDPCSGQGKWLSAQARCGTASPPPVPPAPPLSQFVRRSGTGLVVNGSPFRIHGATAYEMYEKLPQLMAWARDARLNTLEAVLFETTFHSYASVISEATWRRLDRLLAAARDNGIKIILNLSGYAQALKEDLRTKPTTYDWNPYLTTLANRVNTVTNVRYRNDPTIAMIELYGEIDAANSTAPHHGTTAEITSFFKRTLGQLRALDGNHVISTGGFSYLNDPNSGIDWRTIMADPNNDVCDVEIYSTQDREITIPMVSAYCKSIGKPWWLAAWSSCHRPLQFGSDNSSFSSDGGMAGHALDMYNLTRNAVTSFPPAMAAVGSDFWNLGDNPTFPTCDINPAFGQTWGMIRSHAP